MNDIYSILPSYYKHRIAVVGKREFFIKVRDALVECIRKYGFEANAYAEIEEALRDKPTCVVVMQPMMYPIPEDRSVIWIMIQTEQLFHNEKWPKQPFFVKNLNAIKSYLNAYDIILECVKQNIDGLKKMTDATIVHFPSYWYPSLEEDKDRISSLDDKEYDLLFIGTMPGIDNRRKKLLDYLSEHYKVFPETVMWYEEKSKAIANSKICLNIHFDESRQMEMMRMCDYFAYESFVLSEPMYHTEPFVEGQDYVEFFWTNICEKIDYYLAHDEERKRIAQNAHQKLHQYTLMESAKILIDTLLLVSYDKMREKEEEAYRARHTFVPEVKRKLRKILKKK